MLLSPAKKISQLLLTYLFSMMYPCFYGALYTLQRGEWISLGTTRSPITCSLPTNAFCTACYTHFNSECESLKRQQDFVFCSAHAQLLHALVYMLNKEKFVCRLGYCVDATNLLLTMKIKFGSCWRRQQSWTYLKLGPEAKFKHPKSSLYDYEWFIAPKWM